MEVPQSPRLEGTFASRKCRGIATVLVEALSSRQDMHALVVRCFPYRRLTVHLKTSEFAIVILYNNLVRKNFDPGYTIITILALTHYHVGKLKHLKRLASVPAPEATNSEEDVGTVLNIQYSRSGLFQTEA